MTNPGTWRDRYRSPRSVVVVGAGMVGLSTAHFLQDHGVEVTVVDRGLPAAGASWGNAGWLSPALAVPLPEPSVLRYGLRALLDPRSPLSVAPSADVRLWSFLARFAGHCTERSWRQGMRGYLAINAEALAAYDELGAAGVAAATHAVPVTACFTDQAESRGLHHELAQIRDVGQPVAVEEIGGTQLRTEIPQVSARIRYALRISGQRYIDPGGFVQALADRVTARGGRLRTGFTARALRHGLGGITVEGFAGDPERADAVVLATGAWLGDLARPLGVRTPVQAGRGYSVTVRTDEPVPSPLYFPAQRVACTPYRGALRLAGTMEFRHPDAPLDPRRLDAMVSSVGSLLQGVRLDERTDPWVGGRPVTPDGLPLVGPTRAPGVYVAGGHGMWGITLGPATGKLLAEQIATGCRPAALRSFDPLR